MQLNRQALLGLCLLVAPLSMGARGCDPDVHDAESEAGENNTEITSASDEGNGGASGSGGTGGSSSSGGPVSGPTNPTNPADPAKPGPTDPAPVPQDASVIARDAGPAPAPQDAGPGTVGRCGTRGGVQCAAHEFCDYVPSSQCGALDQGGTCKPKTQACTKIYKPVCGCDGKTYGNECTAHSSGVSVAREGECGSKPVVDAGGGGGKMCGGFAGFTCDGKGQFCNYEIEAGGQGCENIADGAGVCQPIPGACTLEYNPVCGCDRHTYSNACAAHSAGISVMRTGMCTDVDCKAIGGRPVDGIGPAPKCAAGETSVGAIRYAGGQIAIEGTICCVK